MKILAVFLILCSFMLLTSQSVHNLMMYAQNSGVTFESVWSQVDGFNDVDVDNKSIAELLSGGNFKAKIQDSWGTPIEFVLFLYSDSGYMMGEIAFEMSNVDKNNLTEWFDPASMFWWSPQPVSNKYINMVTSEGNKELLVTESTASKAWFSIVHNSANLNPAIVVARNSSSISMNKAVTDVLYEGCFPDYEVTVNFMYEDVTSMTVESCFVACGGSGYDNVGMQQGSQCYCATLTASDNNVPAMCTLTCGGNVSQNCGGTNVGYYAVYTGIVKVADIDNLVNSSADNLQVDYTETNDLHFNSTIVIGSHLNWDENYGYSFVTGISVTATTINGSYTSYWFSFTTEFETAAYADQVGGDVALAFPTNGSIARIDALPMEAVVVHFDTPVVNSTILLYGSHESYVYVPYIVLEGDFDECTVTSTSASSSTATSETSSSTSTAADTSSQSSTSTVSQSPSSSDTISTTSTSTDTSSQSSTSTVSQSPSSSDTISTTSTSTDTLSQSSTPTVSQSPSSSDTISTTSTSTDTSSQSSTSTVSQSPSSSDTISTTSTSTDTSSQSSTSTVSQSPSSSDTISTSSTFTYTSTQSTTSTESSSPTSVSTTDSITLSTLFNATVSQPTTSCTVHVSLTSDSGRNYTSNATASIPLSDTSVSSSTPPVTSVTTSTSGTPSTSASSTVSSAQHISYCSPNCTLPVLLNGSYYCPCRTEPVNNNTQTLEEIIEELVAELTVDRTTVSAYTRKYTSAEDKRATAQTVGGIGVIILAVVFGGIIYFDSASLLREIGRLQHNYKHLKRRLSRKSLKVDMLENIEIHNGPSSSVASVSHVEALPTVSA